MDSGNSGSLSLQSSSGGADDEFDSSRPAAAPSASALPGFDGAFYAITPPPSHWPSSTTQLPAGAGASPAPQSSSSHAPASAPAQQAAPRGSRKRARASRRAPTTVLTTDTSNFRAMVQEFTGIPAPPFAAGARSRFDHLLLPTRNPATAALSSSPYLLRPFAHKLHHQAPFVAATPSPANKAAVTTSTSPRMTAVASSRDSYQLASASVLRMQQDHGNYLSFQQSPLLLDGDAARYAPFDAAGFSGLAHDGTTHLHPRRRDDHSDELSGLVGAASVSNNADGGCKDTTISRVAPPLLPRSNAAAGAATTTTPAVRAQGVESWICTSE